MEDKGKYMEDKEKYREFYKIKIKIELLKLHI